MIASTISPSPSASGDAAQQLECELQQRVSHLGKVALTYGSKIEFVPEEVQRRLHAHRHAAGVVPVHFEPLGTVNWKRSRRQT